MRPKTANDTSFINFTKGYPGPGAYDNISASSSKNGFCPNSRYKSPTGAVISKTGQRFDNSRARYSVEMPGPGMYEEKLQFNKTGNYQYYKWKNSGAPLFSRASRLVNLDNSATRKSKF